ncbi:BEACH domain-containing protein C1 [Nymphaea thermarum]|nr:BEACH domain-containing protein C1 [Nymphaea thermarum]
MQIIPFSGEVLKFANVWNTVLRFLELLRKKTVCRKVFLKQLICLGRLESTFGCLLVVVRGVADSLKIITRQAGLTFGEYAFHYAKTHGSHTYKLLPGRCTSQVLRSAFKKMRIYVHQKYGEHMKFFFYPTNQSGFMKTPLLVEESSYFQCLLIHAADVETAEGRRHTYRAIVQARPPHLNNIYLATQTRRAAQENSAYGTYMFWQPIGALNAERLEKFVEGYSSFDDPTTPKFHYGSLEPRVRNKKGF